MAAMKMKPAGKVSVPEARLMVTILSSNGWRSVSGFLGPNSDGFVQERPAEPISANQLIVHDAPVDVLYP
jgi:hypothetical protein